MAGYFEEHNCRELGDGEVPNHLLEIARWIMEGGWNEEIELTFEQLFPDKACAPPASKEIINSMKLFNPDCQLVQQCPICIVVFKSTDQCIQMPCKHLFHSDCILAWLSKTNSCPVCRHELPTDDADYEQNRRQKERSEKRQKDIEELHNAMYM